MNLEIRSGQPVEVRNDNDIIKVSGYAAVFDEETVIYDMFREVIKPGAFRDAVGRDDVVFLVNHEGLPLARTRSGTLKLSEDDRGLFMETELDPEDPDVRSIVPKMKRGDLDKMSFAFSVDSSNEQWSDDEEMPLRSVEKVSLYDVSIVNFPAYEGTEIGLRSKDKAVQSLKSRQKVFNHALITSRMKKNLAYRQITGHPA